jgi:ribosome-binding protein aMBF1 (putative translation factor)
MTLKELKKQLMKSPKFRKASRELDQDAHWQVALAVEYIRIKSGLTQKQLARKIGTKQSGVSRIESSGAVSLTNLSKIAKVLNKKIIIKFQ